MVLVDPDDDSQESKHVAIYLFKKFVDVLTNLL